MEKKLTNSESRRRYNYYNQAPGNPRPRGDQQKVRMFLKQGGSSMLICKGLTLLAASNLGFYMQSFCKKHGTKLEGTFIFTK